MVIRLLALAVALAAGSTTLADDRLGIGRVTLDQLPAEVIQQARETSAAARAAGNQASASEELKWIEQMADAALAQAKPQAAADAPAPAGADAGMQADRAKQHPLGDGQRTLIFVSWSMGAGAIKEILAAYDGMPAVGVVFRGVPEGMPMADAILKMQQLSQQTQSSVSVLLDPTAFQRHGIAVVPAVAIENADEKLVLKAAGISSVRYVEEAAKEGKTGDLGTLGTTSEIIEPDLIEVAKQRIANLDMEAMKRRAIERFWVNQTGHPLPPVATSATRAVDASVIIPEDIRDPKGNLIQAAGRINPLDMMPFNQKLVVIDPTQPWQVELAKREYADHGIGLTVTVIATQIPPASGWELFNGVQEAFGGPLYLLSPALAERFQILRAPSLVTADAKHFIVREIARSDFEEGKDVQD